MCPNSRPKFDASAASSLSQPFQNCSYGRLFQQVSPPLSSLSCYNRAPNDYHMIAFDNADYLLNGME